LKEIFGPKRGKVTGDWRKLYDKQFHNLFFLSSDNRMMKSRRKRQFGDIGIGG
jgi:hypothetical protein